ncbi:integrator complex subunit 8-like [Bolinopsis microptera]|uniref:integrator complex subunit 8-like n=1 Tax=Bolinopsis microptera TaxID=2820187 RepID=UPI00307A55A5
MYTNPNFQEDSFFNKYCNEPPTWFEFMLDGTGIKLRTHLENNYEPSASCLISSFIDKASTHISNTEGAVRQYSNTLWNLATETASFVGWKHEILEEIPTPIRQKLLSYLVKVTVPAEVRAQDISQLNLAAIPKQGLTALFLYHRWICSAFVHLHFYAKQCKQDFEMPGFVPNVNSLQLIEPELSHSMEFLQKVAQNPTDLIMPQVFAFNKLPRSKEVVIPANVVAAQAHFDLGELFFYYSTYTEAYTHFKEATNLYDQSNAEFFSFSHKKVLSYLVGLQFLTGAADILEHKSLASKLELTKASNYDGCVEILLKDNYMRELSLCHRKTFVREVHESCPDRGLHKQAYLCNIMLEVIMGKGTCQLFWDMLKGDKDLVLDFVISATVIYLENVVSQSAKDNLKMFFLSVISKRYMKNRVIDIVNRIGGQLDIKVPKSSTPLQIEKTKMLRYRNGELAECYDKLSSSSSFSVIKDTISRICQLQPNFHVQTFCDRILKDVRKVGLFLPLVDALACPRPLAHILSYKLAHLYHYKSYDKALKLLRDIKEYLKTAQYAAFKRGHNSRPLDKLEVILSAFVLNHQAFVSHHRIKPSEEFLENVELLNVAHHSNAGSQAVTLETSIASAVLLNLDKQPTILEINDGFDFIAGQLWSYIQNSDFDLTTLFKFLLPMHQAKPPEGSMTRSMLLEFCYQITDEMTLELLIAIIVKLFNDSEKPEWHNFNCEIITRGWPKLSKEADMSACLSTLTRLLDHALSVHPHNLKLLTLNANCKMYLGDNESTVRQLLSCGALLSDGFTNLAILDRWLEASFYNLVKACMNINAHIEVALLCCMKTPPDYGTSFQALKRTTDHDSLHVYYPLFWDVNLLECAIAQHHKRNETLLRDFVIGLMGQPEINENNPLILLKRTTEAKKCVFLRTLFFKFFAK